MRSTMMAVFVRYQEHEIGVPDLRREDGRKEEM